MNLNAFNPYQQWLGLSKTESYYQLLRIPNFESDSRKIRAAADRAITRVRSHRPGPHVAQWTQLLDLLKHIKAELTNPELKQAYDAELRARLTAQGSSSPVPNPARVRSETAPARSAATTRRLEPTCVALAAENENTERSPVEETPFEAAVPAAMVEASRAVGDSAVPVASSWTASEPTAGEHASPALLEQIESSPLDELLIEAIATVIASQVPGNEPVEPVATSSAPQQLAEIPARRVIPQIPVVEARRFELPRTSSVVPEPAALLTSMDRNTIGAVARVAVQRAQTVQVGTNVARPEWSKRIPAVKLRPRRSKLFFVLLVSAGLVLPAGIAGFVWKDHLRMLITAKLQPRATYYAAQEHELNAPSTSSAPSVGVSINPLSWSQDL